MVMVSTAVVSTAEEVKLRWKLKKVCSMISIKGSFTYYEITEGEGEVSK